MSIDPLMRREGVIQTNRVPPMRPPTPPGNIGGTGGTGGPDGVGPGGANEDDDTIRSAAEIRDAVQQLFRDHPEYQTAVAFRKWTDLKVTLDRGNDHLFEARG